MISIYVGNIPFASTKEDVENYFSDFGSVNSVNLIMNRETGKPRGYGFVEMDDSDAEKAINELHGKEFNGRELTVRVANPRT